MSGLAKNCSMKNWGTRIFGCIIIISASFVLMPSLLMAGQQDIDFNQAKSINTVEGWENFLEEYPNTSRKGDARRELEKLLAPEFEKVKKTNDLQLLYKFSRTHPHHTKAWVLYPFWEFQEANKQDSLDYWVEYYKRYSGDIGYELFFSDVELQELKNNLKNSLQAIERLLYTGIKNKPNLKQFAIYMDYFGKQGSIHMQEVKAIMEDLVYAYAIERDTGFDLEKYLKLFPEGKYTDEIKAAFERKLYGHIELYKNWDPNMSLGYSAEYLVKIPDGQHAEEVRAHLQWYEDHPAKIKVSAPEVVEWNEEEQAFLIEFTFEERAGDVSYTATGKVQIYDRDGKEWYYPPRWNAGFADSSSVYQSVNVLPNSKSTNTFILNKKMCGGSVVASWDFKDAGRHQSKGTESVRLMCPKGDATPVNK